VPRSRLRYFFLESLSVSLVTRCPCFSVFFQSTRFELGPTYFGCNPPPTPFIFAAPMSTPAFFTFCRAFLLFYTFCFPSPLRSLFPPPLGNADPLFLPVVPRSCFIPPHYSPLTFYFCHYVPFFRHFLCCPFSILFQFLFAISIAPFLGPFSVWSLTYNAPLLLFELPSDLLFVFGAPIWTNYWTIFSVVKGAFSPDFRVRSLVFHRKRCQDMRINYQNLFPFC